MRAPDTETDAAILEVEDLRVVFDASGGSVHAVNGISYRLAAGETLAMLGESGSGKSVGVRAVMGILRDPGCAVSGSVRFRDQELIGAPDAVIRSIRGDRIAMIFQDALSALNPVMSIGDQIAEMFRTHRGLSWAEGRKRAVALLDRVAIPDAAGQVGAYPHQFSGGMRQRVMIAMALALDPDVLIADEPTTALDVTVQAQIMELLVELQQQTGMGLILITHDVGVVAEIADQLMVMYAGRVVESGPTIDIYRKPAHPYTRALLASIPPIDRRVDRLDAIPGTPPDPRALPSGCPVHPRCEFKIERCTVELPVLRSCGPGRATACHCADEVLRAG